MRFHPTASEALLWSQLRGRQLGVTFRRQVVIGEFIVDFLAPQASLIVEVDGDDYHAGRLSADAARERKLRRRGYRVLRLPVSLVQGRLEEAVLLVQRRL
jgi:very-short-patch-repair endonuclease